MEGAGVIPKDRRSALCGQVAVKLSKSEFPSSSNLAWGSGFRVYKGFRGLGFRAILGPKINDREIYIRAS